MLKSKAFRSPVADFRVAIEKQEAYAGAAASSLMTGKIKLDSVVVRVWPRREQPCGAVDVEFGGGLLPPPNVVLVVDKSRRQDIKQIVNALQRQKRKSASYTAKPTA